MESNKQKNERDDRMNDSLSFGNCYNPSSQARKISIGVTVDKNAKMRSGATKEETSLPNSERIFPGEKSIKDYKNSSELTNVVNRKQSNAPEQELSPWISIRPVHQEELNMENVQSSANQTSKHATSSTRNEVERVEEESATKVQFYANRTSILQSGNDMRKKFDTVTYGGTIGMSGTTERVEFAYATAQEVHVLDKGSREGKTEEKEKRSNEALRMKLWEILGTDPSPKEQNSDSQTLDVGAENLKQVRDLNPKGCKVAKQARDLNPKGCKVAKPRHNSDTIEMDSENSEQTVRRPVTRSLTRRKVPKKGLSKLQNKCNSGGKVPPFLSHRQKHREKNAFSFEATEPGRLNGTVNGGSSMSKRKKSVRGSSRIEPCRLFFPEKDSGVKVLANNTSNRPPLAEKALSLGNKMGNLFNFPPKNNNGYIQKENGGIEGTFHYSPVTKNTYQQEDIDKPLLQENGNQQHDSDSPFLKNADPQHDFQSPTFVMKTPTRSCSLNASSPKNNPLEEGVCSPAMADTIFREEGFCHLRTLQTSRAVSHGLEAQMESSDDSRNIKESSPVTGEKDAENGLSQSPSKGWDAESSGEDVTMKKVFRTTVIWSPVRPAKRFCSKEVTKTTEHSPILSSWKGTEESDRSHVPSEQSQEDGVARAVAMFALGLERFKIKMELQTNKKSSAILASVADGIHLQLQNVESQIQTDMQKFVILRKSEKNGLETRFQEQQERLRLIHEKFKEEVDQHFQVCRSTLAKLEAYEMEQKGIAERQKAVHRKLLLQVEEEIENQLGDAERRIRTVHKMAREKMVQLKRVITECLREGIFS